MQTRVSIRPKVFAQEIQQHLDFGREARGSEEKRAQRDRVRASIAAGSAPTDRDIRTLRHVDRQDGDP